MKRRSFVGSLVDLSCAPFVAQKLHGSNESHIPYSNEHVEDAIERAKEMCSAIIDQVSTPWLDEMKRAGLLETNYKKIDRAFTEVEIAHFIPVDFSRGHLVQVGKNAKKLLLDMELRYTEAGSIIRSAYKGPVALGWNYESSFNLIRIDVLYLVVMESKYPPGRFRLTQPI